MPHAQRWIQNRPVRYRELPVQFGAFPGPGNSNVRVEQATGLPNERVDRVHERQVNTISGATYSSGGVVRTINENLAAVREKLIAAGGQEP